MENKKPLVSVITPCFNGEKFVHRLFDSLLAQTYKNLEIIFVNDGSNDQTESIVKSYISRFERLGMKFVYLYQDNQGQAAALNNGLKYFTGDYLVWPDSDDYYNLDSIEIFLKYFATYSDCKIVRSKTSMISEDTGKVIGSFKISQYRENVFEDCLLENNFWYCPISFMIESKAFLELNPKREIFVSPGGQNWQMMLPLLYKYRCGYIEKSNANYLIRESSHSRGMKTFEEVIKRRLIHKEILFNTFARIEFNNDDYLRYLQVLEDKYAKLQYRDSLRFFQIRDAWDYFNKIKSVSVDEFIYPFDLLINKIKSLVKNTLNDSNFR